MPSARVAVVTVAHDCADEVEQLLDSLPAAADGLSLVTVVVDNASQDGVVERVRARDDASLVEAGGNLGYAAGINLARRHLAAAGERVDAIAVLNPDVVLAPGSLRVLVEGLGRPGVGVTAPRICGPDGSPFASLRREPGLVSQLGEALFGAHWAGRPDWLGDALRRDGALDREQEVDWASGAALVVGAAADRAVGDWREDFFLYSEETDFCRRVREQGFSVRYLPQARAEHVGGASGRSPALEALMEVNKLRYYESCHGRLASTIFRTILVVQQAARARRPGARLALRHLLDRSSWSELPHGDRPPIGRER